MPERQSLLASTFLNPIPLNHLLHDPLQEDLNPLPISLLRLTLSIPGAPDPGHQFRLLPSTQSTMIRMARRLECTRATQSATLTQDIQTMAAQPIPFPTDKVSPRPDPNLPISYPSNTSRRASLAIPSTIRSNLLKVDRSHKPLVHLTKRDKTSSALDKPLPHVPLDHRISICVCPPRMHGIWLRI